MLFTYIDYKKPTISLSEQALAKINHLFFLGGQRLTVINDNNEAILKRKNLSWYLVALKVTAIVLLFFISIPLFAFGQLLSNRYSFNAQRQSTKEHIPHIFPGKPSSLSTARSIALEPREPHLDRVEINQMRHQEEEQSAAHSALEASPPYCEGVSSSSSIADESRTIGLNSIYAQLLKNDSYGRYQLTSYPLSVWTQFNLPRRHSCIGKFHLSLKRSVDNIPKAFHALFPILDKYNIASFKTLSPESFFEEIGTDADGKEIVIYVNQDMADPEIWSQQILPEILEAFKAAGVQCGRPSVGDLPVAGGEGFIYTRSPDNALGIYMLADKLESLGFSTFESATISDYPLLNIRINQTPPLAIDEIKLQPKHQLTGEILDEQIELVTQTFNNILNDKSFLYLITGYGYLSKCYYGEVRNLVMKYGENIGDFEKDCIAIVLQEAKLKQEVFAPYFSIASVVIAQLRHYYDIQTHVGKIYPALYEHFIKHPSDLIDEDKKRAIIRDIVLCGLRDGSQTPAKAVQVDEELLAHLITEASI